MKKTLAVAALVTVMLCSFAFASSAKSHTDVITVTNSLDEIVCEVAVTVNDYNENVGSAVQRALDYAWKNATQKDIHTVTLPKGKYATYSSMDIYSNTVLDLSGSTIRRAGNCSSVFRFGRGADVTFGYNGYRNITVKNGTVDSNKTGNTSLMRFAHGYNIVLDSLTFKNTFSVMHQVTFAACKKVVIKNCRFYNMDTSAISSASNCEAVQLDILEESHFYYPSQDGTGTENVTIKDCIFKNLQRGFGTHSAFVGQYFEKINIKNNKFINIEGYAIKAVNYANSTISGNEIKNCGAGIAVSTVPNLDFSNFYANPFDEYIEKPILGLTIKNNTIEVVPTDFPNIPYGIFAFGSKVNKYTDPYGKRINGDYRLSGVAIANNIITSKWKDADFVGIRVEGAYGSSTKKDSDFRIKSNTVIYAAEAAYSGHVTMGIKLKDTEKIYLAKDNVFTKTTGKIVSPSASTETSTDDRKPLLG